MIWHTDGFGSPLNHLPINVTHVFALVLNPMRGRTEEQRLLCVSDDITELQTFLREERVEVYEDKDEERTWHRAYRKGGPLEWFNPPYKEPVDDYGCGIIELKRDGWRRIA